MRINTNISSLNAQRYLERTSKAIGRALERLASGKRINSARDDASGLARASSLEASVRGLRRAALNANDSLGVFATADSTIETLTNVVQRMRELAIQSANGTLNTSNRTSLNSEFQALYSEYNRMIQQTDFNGTKLLDGSFGTRTLQIGVNKNDTIDFGLNDLTSSQVFTKTIGQATFQTALNLPTGGSPFTVVAGDFNGDGNQDLASNDAASNRVTIRLGNGDGTFSAAKTFTNTGSFTSATMVAGDIDGDGDDDLIESNLNTGEMAVRRSNGNGTFTSSQTLDLGGEATNSLKLSDINRDGHLDILVGTQDSYVSMYLNTGNGTFASRITTDFGEVSTSFNFDTGDLNGDGNMDLVVSNDINANTYVKLGNGNGTFGSATQIADILNPKLGDVNNDGILDIVGSGNAGTVIRTQLGIGNGTFQTYTDKTANGSYYINLQDVNGDGNLDVIGGDSALNPGFIELSLGNGNGTYTFAKTLALVGQYGVSANGADFNNDGFLDLFSGSNGTSYNVYLQNTMTTSATATNMSITTQSRAEDVLEVLSTALDNLGTARARIGAMTNRLDSTINNALLTAENLSEARSQIMDTDFASETAELTRLQILQQAQTAVLGQANLGLQLVLNLLKF